MNTDLRTTFATIGHQESWEKITAILNELRKPGLRRLSLEEAKEIIPWIPPRPVVRIRFHSYPRDIVVEGVYIETFIGPSELVPSAIRDNIERVKAAATWAVREGVGVATLGGFTSIVLEGNLDLLPEGDPPFYTTGNTLTVAYIVKGMEAACELYNLNLADLRMLVVGSTGDIGTACVRYFAPKVRSLLLCGRNPRRLESQRTALLEAGHSVVASTFLRDLAPDADGIVFAASTGSGKLLLDNLRRDVVVCDAGYPKNMLVENNAHYPRLFHGGMGLAMGGFEFRPDLVSSFYGFPVEGVGHGCMFEGALLALENRNQAYSRGRGNITVTAIEEIWSMAQAHGMVVAPFFNHEGLWKEQPHSLPTN